MDAQERVARILCRLMGDEWQQGERLYRNTADEIIATLAPASNIAPREAGIQAFYADEGTTNTLQGLNAAFDAYEAAAIASEGIDVLAYRMWSAHPKDLDPWRSTMPANYGGGVRAWFYASEIRGLFVSKAKEA